MSINSYSNFCISSRSALIDICNYSSSVSLVIFYTGTLVYATSFLVLLNPPCYEIDPNVLSYSCLDSLCSCLCLDSL